MRHQRVQKENGKKEKKKGKMRYASFLIPFSFFLCVSVTYAYTSPGRPAGYVNDFAHVLSADTSRRLESELSALHRSTSAEVAVATVPSLGGDTIENYAVKLFEEWGIGEKGKDNGLLILVAVGDKQARIEVGYGLEGDVTDLQAGNIVRDVMIPAFKTGDYDAGVSGAVGAVSGLIEKSPDAEQYAAPASASSPASSSDGGVNWGALFFVVIIGFNILARILGRTRSWWLGGVLGAVAGAVVGLIWGFVPAGLVAIVALTVLGLVFDYIVSRHPPRGGRGGGMGGLWPLLLIGRGRGGSGLGGGFGGFGGGSSGGGGASGRW